MPSLPDPASTTTTERNDMNSWMITATIEDVHGDPVALAEQLVDELPAGSTAVDDRRLFVSFALDDDRASVDEQLVSRARDYLPGGRLIELRIRTEQLLDEELEEPVIPSLVGLAEAAAILGVSRQRAHTMAATIASFPPAVCNLAAGPVFLESAVRAFAAVPRQVGRPKADLVVPGPDGDTVVEMKSSSTTKTGRNPKTVRNAKNNLNQVNRVVRNAKTGRIADSAKKSAQRPGTRV